MGIDIVGTSVDSLERLQRFRDKHPGFVPAAATATGARRSYGTLKSEQADRTRETLCWSAPMGSSRLAYQRVRAEGHAAQVLADARRLHEEGSI